MQRFDVSPYPSVLFPPTNEAFSKKRKKCLDIFLGAVYSMANNRNIKEKHG